MQKINFSYNWNRKLDCKVFTTIRKAQQEKYHLDNEYEIWLKDEMKGVARLHDTKIFNLTALPSFTAFLDTGYCLEETQAILRRMYHLQPGQDIELIMLLLIYKQP